MRQHHTQHHNRERTAPTAASDGHTPSENPTQ
nr:MAG TPA: hypothetical protein [Caudoviricetes sp.]